MKSLLALLLTVVLNSSAFADPQLTSWATPNSAQYARIRATTGATPVTTWTGQTLPAYSDVQTIMYSTSNVYVYASGLASYIMGPWYLNAAKTMIFPAAIRYQSELAVTCANLKAVGYAFDTNTLDKVTALVKSLQDTTAALEKTMEHHGASNLLAEAKHYCHDVVPAMVAVRKIADELEGIVADDLWPLPTYQEMLFIK